MTGARPPRPGRTRLAGLLALAGALLATSACGGDGSAATAVAPAPSTTTERATTTTRPPTTTTRDTVPPSTAAPTTSTSTTTTTVPVTLPAQQTTPIAAPADVWAQEPEITMGTLSIPKIGVSMTMYSGIRLTTLDKGPGHWPGTALPGQVGNVVVAGHRTSSHRVFRDIDQLVPGDEIVFEDAGVRHVYRVTGTQIVDPYAVWIVDPTDTPTATLFACHPPGSTRERIVVFADLVTA